MSPDQNPGRYRFEVGGSNPQVVVYYTDPGEPRVTYIIGPQEDPGIWYGYGQIWEERACSDLAGWAREESQRQMALGHSGITVDLRDGSHYNDGDLPDEEVEALLDEQQRVINDSNGNAASDFK